MNKLPVGTIVHIRSSRLGQEFMYAKIRKVFGQSYDAVVLNTHVISLCGSTGIVLFDNDGEITNLKIRLRFNGKLAIPSNYAKFVTINRYNLLQGINMWEMDYGGIRKLAITHDKMKLTPDQTINTRVIHVYMEDMMINTISFIYQSTNV